MVRRIRAGRRLAAAAAGRAGAAAAVAAPTSPSGQSGGELSCPLRGRHRPA